MNRALPLPFPRGFNALELCAGGGGQALGLEAAGFDHAALIEVDAHACATLRLNRPAWTVLQADINDFDPSDHKGVDSLAAGLPCPPFSRAGKQLGVNDDRNLWPAALRILGRVKPKAVMFENVRGILDAVFDDFRTKFSAAKELDDYITEWKLLNASDYGVSQLRPRVVFVAIRKEFASPWEWPAPSPHPALTVGEKIYDLMLERGWRGAKKWRQIASEIAPTIVGGSLKHGGPVLDQHALAGSGPALELTVWELLTRRPPGITLACRGSPLGWSRAFRAFLTIGNSVAGRPHRTVRWETPSRRRLLKP